MSDDKLFEEFRRLVLDAEKGGVEDPPLNEDDALKAELRRQSREDSLGPDDPRSDDELWQEALRDERFRAALRGEGSE